MASPLIGIAGVNSLLFASYGVSQRIISPFPRLSLAETARLQHGRDVLIGLAMQMSKVLMQGQYGGETDKCLRVTVAREIPADAGFYTAYEFSKRQFGAKYGDQLPIWALLASGSTGDRILADVIKSHIRPRKTPPTGTPVQYIGHEFKLIVAESGLALSPFLLRSIPAAASTSAAFELTREWSAGGD
ncbi:hypothetical protein DFH09DRAFT_1327577 [Mycena vulgaris]|nr:hypothetical protein DFH09DRAFT_1327577 [Mycena vulgaris]